MREKTITELWVEQAKNIIVTENTDTFHFHSSNNFDYEYNIEDNNIIVYMVSGTNTDYGYLFKIKNKSIVWEEQTKALLPDDLVDHLNGFINRKLYD